MKHVVSMLRSLVKPRAVMCRTPVYERPEAELGVELLGHREYVGGKWDEIGKLQFEFLISRGLEPHHCLLDIACGSLRAGVHLIPYLDRGNYLGIEKEQSLIDAGIKNELGDELYREKAPELIVSSEFDFSRFENTPQFALAQSLFTHLTPDLIMLCMRNLREVMLPDGQCFVTFFVRDRPRPNPAGSHDHATFRYTKSEIAAFGKETGWDSEYIGDWGHPRKQMMVCYRPV